MIRPVTMSGAEALLRCLQEEGVDVIFGYPGGAVLPIYDALYDSPLRHILVRHEQGAIHAAEGYARATGKVGVCLATSGPGATNLMTGLCDAMMDSIPIVAVTGQVVQSLIGKDGFQEADVTGMSMPVTKHNYSVRKVEDLPRVIKEAFHIARTGRPGPVLVDIPKDIANARFTFSGMPATVNLPGYKPTYHGHPTQIAKAAELINEATKPLLYVGGGAVTSGAGELIQQLAEKANIPIALTLMGLGVVPDSHPNFIGMLGMHGLVPANSAISNCDVLIALGVRFDDRVTGKLETFAKNAKVIHIDIDPAEIGKNVEALVPIVGDLSTVLPELLPRVRGTTHKQWWAKIKEWQDAYPLAYEVPTSGQPKPQQVIEALSRRMGDKDIVAVDVGQHQMWTAHYYNFRSPRTWLSSSGLGTMGFGLPAAIGAQVAFPQRKVALVTGDGSFQMCIQELATLVENNLPVKIVIVNNGYLGMVRQWQEMFHDNRYKDVQFTRNPDFALLAKAYGIKGLTITDTADVEAAFDEAFAHDGPVVMDFHVTAEENVYPMVPPGGSVEKMIVGRQNFEE